MGVMHDALLLAAPAVTIATSYFWILVASWVTTTTNRWQIEGAIRETEQILGLYEQDGSCTPSEIANARDALVNLRKMRIDLIQGKVAEIQASMKKFGDS
jgi:hypothetical protein